MLQVSNFETASMSQPSKLMSVRRSIEIFDKSSWLPYNGTHYPSTRGSNRDMRYFKSDRQVSKGISGLQAIGLLFIGVSAGVGLHKLYNWLFYDPIT